MKARTFIVILLTSVFITCAVGGFVTTKTALSDVTGDTWDYVVLGSSIGTWWARNYGNMVESDLGVKIRYHNYYVSAQRVGDLLHNVQNDEKLRTDVRDAELVTIGVGFADMYFGCSSNYQRLGSHERKQRKESRRELEKKLETFGETYDALLDEVLDLASPNDTVIHVMDFYFPYVAMYKEESIYDETMHYWKAFNECIINSAQRHNIPTAQIFYLFNGANADEDPVEKGLIAGDRLHPNLTGKKLIAEEFRKLGYQYIEP